MHSGDPVALRHGPLTVYLTMFQGEPDVPTFLRTTLPAHMPLVWLDSARPHVKTGRWSMIGYDPWLTYVAHGPRCELRTRAATAHWHLHPLQGLRRLLRGYRIPTGTQAHARAVGLMGCLSYELNRWIEPSVPSWNRRQHPAATAWPDMLWFGMRGALLVDHFQHRSWLLQVVDPYGPPARMRRQALEALEWARAHLVCLPSGDDASRPQPPIRRGACSSDRLVGPPPLVATTSQAEFERMVNRALTRIRAGDIFQANVAQQFTTTWRGDALALYQALRVINPSPFACFLRWRDWSVVSCSPERLVRVEGGTVDTRPIAGTRPRGATPHEDVMNSLELLLSEKERAEHIMLVDLARNDLGRVCRVGSVAVDELMELEEYSHVIHIVSDVAGLLRPGLDAVEVIRAIFPGGTITGCPKVRCMQILRQLEAVPRGLYTGSVGYLGFDGTMDLNIAIRTMVLAGEQVSFHVGAGIVADSDPQREYHETLAKAHALIAALGVGEREAVGGYVSPR